MRKKMLTKIEAYRCPNGGLETDLVRAFAWKLSDLSSKSSSIGSSIKLNFSESLWVLENRETIKKVIEALEKELEV
jgi:hypothetical protein